MSSYRSLTFAPVLAWVLSGCAMMETTTTVRTLPGPATERVRLVRPDAAAVAASWKQEGSTLVGQLSFTNACLTETVQLDRRTQVTETHPNPTYTTGAYVAGAVMAAAGVVFMATAHGKSEVVYCGSPGGAPKSGDTCDSEAGAWRTIGWVALGAGVGTALGGVLVHTRKPVVESKDLPSAEQVRVIPNRGGCGSTSSLEGAVVRASLSSGGNWIGTADETGIVRIELAGAAYGQRAHASFTLESVRPGVSRLAISGSPLGELDLQTVRPSPRRAFASKSTPIAARD
jgi:hypothetical protein